MKKKKLAPKNKAQLEELMEYISVQWKFTPKNYPILEKLSKIEREDFALGHIVKHMQKSLGKIASYSEAIDHNDEPSAGDFPKGATVKMIVNALRLATILGISADDIIETIREFSKDDN